MKTTKELLKQNGWKEGAYDDDVDEQYYWKENVCTLVAIHNSVDDVKIDTSIFEPEYVEPDFLRKILEEVKKNNITYPFFSGFISYE